MSILKDVVNHMKIDISKLSEAELIDLNNKIFERLRFLNHMRTHEQMLEFNIGERVTFQPEGQTPVTGMITRYNKKTITVITDDGQHWNVSPRFLRKVVSESVKNKSNVIRFKKD
jgi:hypothetical protein